MPSRKPNSAQPASAQSAESGEKKEFSPHASGAHVCLFCGGKIPLLARWRGLRDFCSDQHQQLYWGETQRLAADAIRRQRISRRSAPEPETKPDGDTAASALDVSPEHELERVAKQDLLALQAVTTDAAPERDAAPGSEDDQDPDLPAGTFRLEAAVLMEIAPPAPANLPAQPLYVDPSERATPKGGTEVEIPQTDFDPVVAEVSYAPVEAWLKQLPVHDPPALPAATARAIEPSPIDNADLATLASWLHYPERQASPEEEPPVVGRIEIPLAPVVPEAQAPALEFWTGDSDLTGAPDATALYATRQQATVQSPIWFPQQEMVPVFREVLSASVRMVRPRFGMQPAEQLARCILPVGVNESEEPREFNPTEARSAARTPMGGPATCRFELVSHAVQQRTLRLRRAGIRQLGTYVPQMRLRTLRPRLVRRRWDGAGSSVVKVDGSAEPIRADV